MLTSKLEFAVQILATMHENLSELSRELVFGASPKPLPEEGNAQLVAQVERELELLRQALFDAFPALTQPFVVHYSVVDATTALFCQDKELRYLWASAGFRVHDHTDWQGKKDDDLLPPAAAAHLTQLKRAVMQDGQGRSETILSTERGRSVYLELTLEAWRNGDGEIAGVVGACTDVTPWRQAQGEKERQQALMIQQQSQLRQLNLHLAMLQASAERDISRHLHDNIGALLTALNLDLTLAERELGRTEPFLPAIQQLVDDSLYLLAQISEGTSKMIEQLRPPHLENEGLAAALLWCLDTFRRRQNMALTLNADADFPRLDSIKEYELYLIAQEAITNAVKHSQAQQVAVSLHADANRISLVIVDNGIGIDLAYISDSSTATAHWGLVNMMERAELIGGSCKILSRPGAGTQIVVEVQR
jgi:signal transduction histidine kinase